MSTKREIIDSLRNKLREKNSDSTYSTQFLYQTILEQTQWLILRESSAGRIWGSNFLFQNYIVRMIEVPLIDSCLPIKAKCTIYRSAEKLPDIWQDGSGPMLKSVSSVDGSIDYFYTTSGVWMHKRKDPYKSKSNQKYCFFEDGYLWIPEDNPHYASVLSYYTDDVSLHTQQCLDCEAANTECVRFLDTPFTCPQWVEAEIIAKSLELLAGTSKRMPEDEEINKNTTRKT